MLALAGIDEAEMAAASRQAFDVMKRNLVAKKTELVAFRGNYQEVNIPDLTTNQRAAEALLDVTGVSLSRQDSRDGPGDVHITIQFPAACQPTTAIDVTPPREIEAMPPEKTVEPR
jgi:hypothetical protein